MDEKYLRPEMLKTTEEILFPLYNMPNFDITLKMVHAFLSFCKTYGGHVNDPIIRLVERVICYVVRCIITCFIVTIRFYCFICTLDTMVRSHYSYLLFNYTHTHV